MSSAQRPTVIDAGGHVAEPPMLWSEYVAPAYPTRVPQPAGAPGPEGATV